MRVAVIAFSPLGRDSRVLRTAGALRMAGHEVLLVGYGPAPQQGGIATALLPGPPAPLAIRLGLLLRQAPATLVPASAHRLYWLDRTRRSARDIVRAFRPGIVHANDWNTLPVALDAKERFGARIVYDAHEMAVAEHEESLTWRLAALAHVRAVERRGIARADAVITVSPGIARALAKAYPGIAAPVVIRNVPEGSPAGHRATGALVTVLFLGLLRPNRGLEPLIASVPLWREEFRLVLRGGGAPGYVAALRAQAEAAGAARRVEVRPPVAPHEVVAAASTADLGVLVLPDTSRHNRFALPNKLFEYLMAGLGVIVSDLPDMAEIVRAFSCGAFADPDPASIARTLNALDRRAIDAMKRGALAAAGVLNWDREREKLLDLYDRLAT